MSMLRIETDRKTDPMWLARIALGAVGVLVVAIGVALAVSDRAMSDAKSSIASGDEVMAVLPDGDGYSWQGPFVVSERKSYTELTLRAEDSAVGRPVLLSDVMPVSMYKARQRAKGEAR